MGSIEGLVRVQSGSSKGSMESKPRSSQGPVVANLKSNLCSDWVLLGSNQCPVGKVIVDMIKLSKLKQ